MSKQNQGMRKRLLVLAVAGAMGVTGTAMAAVPTGARAVAPVARAAVGTQFAVLTQPTRLNKGDVVQNTVPLNKQVRITVALKLRDEAGMQAFLARPAATRGVMSQAQLQGHLPTQAQAQAVADYLKGAGFSQISIAPNRMLVHAVGNAAAVQTAFKTSLVNVRTADGRSAFANSAAVQLPAALRGNVVAVLGLQTLHKAHTMQVANPVGVQGHQATEFADIYDASSLAPATNVNVAVLGWGSMSNTLADLTNFEANTGLSAGTVTVVCTNYDGIDFNTGTANGGFSTTDPTCNQPDEGETEWAMDSQTITAMTGGVNSLTFYASYGGYNITITDDISEAVTPTQGEAQAQVANMSFGECERDEDSGQGGDGSAQADDALFQVAAAQGETFSASTGDSGSDECGDGQLNSASYPASSPWVVAVSGTTLRASTTRWARENVWLGAGGSPSSFEPAQSWQTALTYGQFKGMRGPDVAFDANPSSGEMVLLGCASQCVQEQVGGTSLASPLFVGSWARILQTDTTAGFAAPNLYTLPAAVLHDVRAGNNGQYIAKPGWDWATGLGSFDVTRAAALLAPQD